MFGSDLSCFVGSPFTASEAPTHGNGLEVENAGHHGNDAADASPSWESAWIDLGGEG